MDTGEALVEAGFSAAVIADNAEQALNCIQAEPIDFVLLNTELVTDLTEILLAAIRTRSIPLVFSTSLPDGQDIPATWQSAAFVTKPYTACDLRGVLAQMFSGHAFFGEISAMPPRSAGCRA